MGNNPKREIHSITSPPSKKKQEKAQINNLTSHLRELEKDNKAQSEWKEGNNKDQSRNK